LRHGLVCIALFAPVGGYAAIDGGTVSPAAAMSSDAMLTLTDRDNGRHVQAHVGDELELHLAENATTGYRWAIDNYDAGVIEFVETSASYPDAAVGSGGEAIFRFRVIGPGSSPLALKYWRHWEGAGSIIQRFAVTIDAAR